MKQYVDKAAVVAEIEKTKKFAKHKAEETADKYWQFHFDGWVTACNSMLSFLDTLEVKEMDLDSEIKKYIQDNICGYLVPDTEETAKYFFELGLKAQKGEQL